MSINVHFVGSQCMYLLITEMDGEDNEDSAHKRKPWGKSFHFCPVALNEKNVLWPGNQETALRLAETNRVAMITTMLFISGIVITSIT